MAPIVTQAKRLLVGRPFSNDRLARERLPKRLAFPVFSADTLSSLAYAPDQIILTLAVAGSAAVTVSPWVGMGVLAIMGLVLSAHRSVATEFPEGGGDFAVAHTNLGRRAGQIVGASLTIDYVLTVAVSTSQAARYVAGAAGLSDVQHLLVTLGLIALLTLVNLRGVRQATYIVTIPVALFVGSVGLLIVVGAVQAFMGELSTAPSAAYEVVPSNHAGAGLTAIGGTLLVIRALSQGCVAISGIKSITNAVPNFKPPKAPNATATMVVAVVLAMVFLGGVVWLARWAGVVVVEDPATQLRIDGAAPTADFQQVPVLGQVAQAVAPGMPWVYLVITVVTALILCIAASTAFNGFPTLASVLAVKSYVPRFFAARGDRLAYSNGIIALALAAAVTVVITDGSVTRLIHMYLVGVFVSFTCGQAGLSRHFHARMRVSPTAPERRMYARKSRAAQASAIVLALLLIFVVVTQAGSGAWMMLAIIAVLVSCMALISRHYRSVAAQQALPPGPIPACSPIEPTTHGALGTHAVVIMTELTRPAVVAMKAAMSEPHATVQAIMVKQNDEHERKVRAQWRDHAVGIPLRILYSPYRDAMEPVREYVRSLRRVHPDDSIIVFIPEYLVGHWWHAALHNHALRRVQSRLGHIPSVSVVSVPWGADALDS